ncbi:MAG TPA: NADH-quinone oxidoreductase subunit C [Geobacteraceae bacterium]|nr:NADH-quinone oxidoreductase subunit C [Geobacteraceae bacterium]
MKQSVVVLDAANTKECTSENIISVTKKLKDGGNRLITLSSADLGDSIDILYHFDLDLDLADIRVNVPKGKKTPSIASVYPCAFLVENEIKEHFGVDFDGLPLDFAGMLYLDEEVQKTPFCKIGINRVETQKQEA